MRRHTWKDVRMRFRKLTRVTNIDTNLAPEYMRLGVPLAPSLLVSGMRVNGSYGMTAERGTQMQYFRRNR